MAVKIRWTTPGGRPQRRWSPWSWLRGGLLAGLVLWALLLTLARWWLPYGSAYREDIERQLSAVLHTPVHIGRVSSRLSGFTPAFRLEQVSLQFPDTRMPALRLPAVTLALDPLASVRQWRLVPRVITLHVQRLQLSRDAGGRWSVAGLPTAEAAADGAAPPLTPGQVLAWLQRLPDVRVQAEVLELALDGQPGWRARIAGASLALHGSGEEYRAQLVLGAAPPWGQGLRLMVKARLPQDDPAAAELRAYVQADGWQLPAWWAGWAGAESAPQQGVLDARLWLEWRQGRLQALSGQWQAQSVVFPAGEAVFGALRYGRVGAHFDWQSPEPGRWRLRAAEIRLERNGHAWPPGALEIALAPGADGRPLWTGGLDYLRLEDVTPLLARLPLPLEQHALWLRRFAPRGEIRQLTFALPADAVPSSAGGWQVRAEVQDLGWRPWGDVPGLAGLDARLAAGQDGGVAELAAQEVLLDPAALFRDPLVFSRLHGVVYWQRRGADWWLGSDDLRAGNDHLAAQGRFTLQLPADVQEAALDLHAELRDADPRYVSLYLPAHVLSPEAIAWLDQAFLGGRVPQVDVEVRGRLADFPFDPGPGRFRVAFRPEGGVLRYLPGWPLLEDLAGEVVFSGRRLDITAPQGRVLGVAVRDARAHIADLEAANPVLEVTGQAEGPAQDFLRFLDQSGLGEGYRDTLRAAVLEGRARLALQLHIPLGGGEPQVRGQVRLPGNALHLQDWALRLDDIAGDLQFTADSILVPELSARIGDAPARIRAHTESGGARRHLIELETETSLQALAGPRAGALARLVPGRVPWSVRLEIPQRQQAGQPLAGRVYLHSPLTGVRLPPPWDRAAASLGLSLEAALSGPEADVLRLDVGAAPGPLRIQALLQLQGQGTDARRLRRGAVQFGTGSPELPAEDGLVVRGELPSLDVPAWQQWLAALQAPPARPTPGSRVSARSAAPTPEAPALPLLELSLQAQQVRAFGRQLAALQCQVRRQGGRYALAFDGPELKGEGHYDPAAGGSLSLRLERLALPPTVEPAATPGDPLDPRTVPQLDLQAARFRYEDRELGSLGLRTQRAPAGQQLQELVLALPSGALKATGDWLMEESTPVLRLRGELSSEDWGATLAALGFPDTVAGGRGELPFQLRVAGGPERLGLDSLEGQVRLQLRHGRLLEVEPGAGRIFGLLSFTTLTRRLRLDFSDLFGKGLAFDHIEGQFELSAGQAYTNHLQLRGPSGQVEVAGRVGLSAHDYDQTVTVRPNLSASLPLAGVLTGGIGVGAALLLTHGLFKDPVNQMVEFQYRLRGDWAKPDVEAVSRDDG